ncbi:MAG: hypothetical protein BWY95_00052 [Bacteroidetes bacterium ADurb.BinA104]|nr:MAG: hypothetical protein BWY95_00052 [Bacteroidetes bacterium ADurb.BinA104]
MNNERKLVIQKRLQEALEETKMSQGKAATNFGVNQGYVSMIKTGNNWKAIPECIWERMYLWVETGMSLADYVYATFTRDSIAYKSNNVEQIEPVAKEEPEPQASVPPGEAIGPSEEELKKQEAVRRGVDKIIERLEPVKLQSKEAFWAECQGERLLAVKHALIKTLQEGDRLPKEWLEEYDDLWVNLNLK